MIDQTEQRFVMMIHHTPDMGEGEIVDHIECITTHDPEEFKEALFDELEAVLAVKAEAETATQRVRDFAFDDPRRMEAVEALGKIMNDPRYLRYPSITVQGHYLPGVGDALTDEESGAVRLMDLDEWFRWQEATSLRIATDNRDHEPMPGLDVRDDWHQSRATLAPR